MKRYILLFFFLIIGYNVSAQDSSDLSLVNSPPIISQVPILSTPFDPIDLSLYAEDPEGGLLSFSFEDGSVDYNSN